MKKRLTVVMLVAGAALASASAGSAHQVTPPGLGGACTTNVHAGDPTNPAHSGGMQTAASKSPAITPGACAT